MGSIVSIIVFGLACYLAYVLLFNCNTHNDYATKVQKIPTFKETTTRELISSKHKKLKRRVTAIRTGDHPGLYDKGILVDNLDKSLEYEVQELSTSRDKKFYKLNFFNTKEEFVEACDVSEKIENFKKFISDELY